MNLVYRRIFFVRIIRKLVLFCPFAKKRFVFLAVFRFWVKRTAKNLVSITSAILPNFHLLCSFHIKFLTGRISFWSIEQLHHWTVSVGSLNSKLVSDSNKLIRRTVFSALFLRRESTIVMAFRQCFFSIYLK